MNTVTAESQAQEADAERAGINAVWVVAALVAFAAYWLAAQALRGSSISEPRVKGWLTVLALLGAAVQVLTMSRVYGWIPIPPGPAAGIQAVHRWSGRSTILLGSFVFYLCVTYPFTHGFTWHRLFGFLFAAVLIAKLTILRGGIDGLSRLLPYLGFALLGLFIMQFATKGLSNLW